MPTLVGSNADEGTAYPVAMSPVAFAADAEKRYGADAQRLLALYPAETDAEARAASYALMRDRTFAAPMRRWASEQSLVAPVFVYHLQPRPPVRRGLGLCAADAGQRHGCLSRGGDGLCLWHARRAEPARPQTRAWTEADRRYSDTMMAYWLAFARNGDPNAEGLPAWPAYKLAAQQAMLFGKTIAAGALPNKAQLDFFFDRN